MKAAPVRRPFQPLTGSEALKRQLAYKKAESLKAQIQEVRQERLKIQNRSEADRQARLEAQSRAEASDRRAEEMATITNRLLFDENITPEEKALLKERLKAITVSKK